jgi:hypothetical protein
MGAQTSVDPEGPQYPLVIIVIECVIMISRIDRKEAFRGYGSLATQRLRSGGEGDVRKSSCCRFGGSGGSVFVRNLKDCLVSVLLVVANGF